MAKADSNKADTLKPRLPRSVQFFDNAYNSDPELMLQRISEFNEEVHQYYDLRDAAHPVPTYDVQIAQKAVDQGVLERGLGHARAQGFDIER